MSYWLYFSNNSRRYAPTVLRRAIPPVTLYHRKNLFCTTVCKVILHALELDSNHCRRDYQHKCLMSLIALYTLQYGTQQCRPI